MEVLEWFRELSAEAKVRISLMSAEELRAGDLCIHLCSVQHHLDVLMHEQMRNSLERDLGKIRRAFRVVKELGAPLGLFEKYKGDDELKNHLLMFLNQS